MEKKDSFNYYHYFKWLIKDKKDLSKFCFLAKRVYNGYYLTKEQEADYNALRKKYNIY